MCPAWLFNPDKEDPVLSTQPGPPLASPHLCVKVSDGPGQKGQAPSAL